MTPPLRPLTANPGDNQAPSSSGAVGAADGLFTTSVAPTSNGGIGQSGSAPCMTADTHCAKRYKRAPRRLGPWRQHRPVRASLLFGVRPMWLEQPIAINAAWRR